MQFYATSQNAALTCRRCGISKKTLSKWWRRYQEQGEAGLRSQSRRPHKLRQSKVTPDLEGLILQLRRTRKLGPKGLVRELLRLHRLRLSTRTIWKVLKAHGVSVLRPSTRPRQPKRYTRPEPGARSPEPGARSPEPGARSPEPGARSPEPGARSPEPGARSPEPGARSPEPGARSPEPGARSPEPGARSPEPGARSPEPGARSPEPGARSPEPGARSPEPGARSPEPGARSPEPGARSPEPGARRAESGERRAESGERRAESGERRAESGERRAESGERRAESGERVQVDTCKIGRNLYQFTAIDDCTRLRVLALYPSRTSVNAAHFVQHHLLEQWPFPIQGIQSDRGGEFIGREFQDALRKHHIKFRPNRPRAPHLNGKVERSQRTDRMEFWSTINFKEPKGTPQQLNEWQHFYNQERTHSAIGSKTPLARLQELLDLVPKPEEVRAAYAPPRAYATNNHYFWSIQNGQ